MALYLIIVPLIGALAAFLLPSDRPRPWIVASTAVIHLALAATAIARLLSINLPAIERAATLFGSRVLGLYCVVSHSA